jgi:hypothetical protein
MSPGDSSPAPPLTQALLPASSRQIQVTNPSSISPRRISPVTASLQQHKPSDESVLEGQQSHPQPQQPSSYENVATSEASDAQSTSSSNPHAKADIGPNAQCFDPPSQMQSITAPPSAQASSTPLSSFPRSRAPSPILSALQALMSDASPDTSPSKQLQPAQVIAQQPPSPHSRKSQQRQVSISQSDITDSESSVDTIVVSSATAKAPPGSSDKSRGGTRKPAHTRPTATDRSVLAAVLFTFVVLNRFVGQGSRPWLQVLAQLCLFNCIHVVTSGNLLWSLPHERVAVILITSDNCKLSYS